MRLITWTERTAHGPLVKSDAAGGVFRPDAERGLRMPVYVMGHAHEGSDRVPVFSCPVSAIPSHVWALLNLWFVCNRMGGALPLAGGVLDQPSSVQRAFPFFQVEHDKLERRRDAHRQTAAIATTLAAVFGGKGKS